MYDARRWAFARNRTFTPYSPAPYWMDVRHTAFLYEALLGHPFRKVLEVGCFDGASTSAIVQALNEGCSAEVHLCDTQLRPCLREVVARSSRPITLHERPSVEVLAPGFDLVILDGDHRIATVSREVGLILAYQIPTVIAHDTAAPAELLPDCEGSRFLGHVFRGHPAYGWLEDAVSRPGEFTHRGFLLASSDPAVIEGLRPAWERLMR